MSKGNEDVMRHELKKSRSLHHRTQACPTLSACIVVASCVYGCLDVIDELWSKSLARFKASLKYVIVVKDV